MFGLALIAFVFCMFGTALMLLLTFLLLPWARERLGGWALALIPLSAFMGAYFGWGILWLIVIELGAAA